MDLADDFFKASVERAWDSSEFLHIATEQDQPTPEQRKYIEAGMALGITSAVDELNARGWLRAP